MTAVTGPRFRLLPLASGHDVQHFTCGDRPGAAEIDEYLTANALADQKAGLSQVWLAVDTGGTTPAMAIAGYFTLSPLSVPVDDAVLAHLGLTTLPYRHVGGYLLGRLGVAVAFQGHGLGPLLIVAAIKIARKASAEVGGAFLAVDPKNDRLLVWYERLDFGFRRLDPQKSTRRRLVLRL